MALTSPLVFRPFSARRVVSRTNSAFRLDPADRLSETPVRSPPACLAAPGSRPQPRPETPQSPPPPAISHAGEDRDPLQQRRRLAHLRMKLKRHLRIERRPPRSGAVPAPAPPPRSAVSPPDVDPHQRPHAPHLHRAELRRAPRSFMASSRSPARGPRNLRRRIHQQRQRPFATLARVPSPSPPPGSYPNPESSGGRHAAHRLVPHRPPAHSAGSPNPSSLRPPRPEASSAAAAAAPRRPADLRQPHIDRLQQPLTESPADLSERAPRSSRSGRHAHRCASKRLSCIHPSPPQTGRPCPAKVRVSGDAPVASPNSYAFTHVPLATALERCRNQRHSGSPSASSHLPSESPALQRYLRHRKLRSRRNQRSTAPAAGGTHRLSSPAGACATAPSSGPKPPPAVPPAIVATLIQMRYPCHPTPPKPTPPATINAPIPAPSPHFHASLSPIEMRLSPRPKAVSRCSPIPPPRMMHTRPSSLVPF